MMPMDTKHHMTKLKPGDPDATFDFWGTDENGGFRMLHSSAKVQGV